MTTKQIEAMKLALEALEMWCPMTATYLNTRDKATTALRRALEQPEKQVLENFDELFDKQKSCPSCCGMGRMVRDPDIGIDQECFVCDGSGAIEPEQPAPVPEAHEQEPVGYWQGEYSKDGGATLYEVPQESVFGRKYRNIPLYDRPQTREPLLREIAALSANALDDYKLIQKLMAEREPLSEVQIATVYWGATGQSLRPQDNALAHKFARAIEAAHGIHAPTERGEKA